LFASKWSLHNPHRDNAEGQSRAHNGFFAIPARRKMSSIGKNSRSIHSDVRTNAGNEATIRRAAHLSIEPKNSSYLTKVRQFRGVFSLGAG
jgi:hypothetical protein